MKLCTTDNLGETIKLAKNAYNPLDRGCSPDRLIIYISTSTCLTFFLYGPASQTTEPIGTGIGSIDDV
jgi:hypothetical protein